MDNLPKTFGACRTAFACEVCEHCHPNELDYTCTVFDRAFDICDIFELDLDGIWGDISTLTTIAEVEQYITAENYEHMFAEPCPYSDRDLDTMRTRIINEYPIE